MQISGNLRTMYMKAEGRDCPVVTFDFQRVPVANLHALHDYC